MNKGVLQILILFGSVLAGILLVRSARGTERFSDCLVDQPAYDSLTAGRTPADDLVSDVVFGEEHLLYDREAGTLYYSLPEGDSSAYDPSVIPDTDEKKVRLAILGGAITDDLIRENSEWKLLFYNDSSFQEAALKCTTLPVMNVEFPGELPDESKEPVDMRLSLYDNRRGAVQRLTVSDGTIHLRGQSTLMDPKKSYRISLKQRSVGENTRDNDRSLLGMRQDEDWILYCAGNDQEMVRNVFCTALWTNGCGTDNGYHIQTGSEYRYLELFLDGRYAGLYALGYPLQKQQFMIGDDPEKNSLYKIYAYGDLNHLYLDNDGTVLDQLQVSSGEDAPDRSKLLRDYYIALGLNCHDSGQLRDGIDMDNAIDFWLFVNLIQGLDNLDNNQYLALRNETDGIRGLYAPWDMDITWGNGFRSPYVYYPDDDFVLHSGYLYQLLYNDDSDVRDMVLEKYAYLRRTAWSDHSIGELIDEAERAIYGSGAFQRDIERWPENPHQSDENELKNFGRYVRDRLEYFDHRMQGSIFDSVTEEYPVVFEMDLLRDLEDTWQAAYEEDACFCLEIMNPEIWDDAYYRDFYDEWGIPESMRVSGPEHTREIIRSLGVPEPVTDDVDAVFWTADGDIAEAVSGLHVSGNALELSVGNVLYYEDDAGNYGLYLDSHELVTGDRTDPDTPDIRLLAYYPDEEETLLLKEWKTP